MEELEKLLMSSEVWGGVESGVGVAEGEVEGATKGKDRQEGAADRLWRCAARWWAPYKCYWRQGTRQDVPLHAPCRLAPFDRFGSEVCCDMSVGSHLSCWLIKEHACDFVPQALPTPPLQDKHDTRQVSFDVSLDLYSCSRTHMHGRLQARFH